MQRRRTERRTLTRSELFYVLYFSRVHNHLTRPRITSQCTWCSHEDLERGVVTSTINDASVTSWVSTAECGRYIYLDSMSMRSHVGKTMSSCLRHLWSIRRSVTRPVLQSLVVLLVLSRLWQEFLRAFFSDFSRYRMQRPRRRGSTASARCFAHFTGWAYHL